LSANVDIRIDNEILSKYPWWQRFMLYCEQLDQVARSAELVKVMMLNLITDKIDNVDIHMVYKYSEQVRILHKRIDAMIDAINSTSERIV
jgi:hypothetical protein